MNIQVQPLLDSVLYFVDLNTVITIQPILHAGNKGHGEQRCDTGKATECRRSQGIYQG
jgi:hypothetical protein